MTSVDIDRALTLGGLESAKLLLTLPEGQWFDRKSGRVEAKDLARPMVAFANAEGGTIALGLSDGRVDGVSAKRENEYRQAAIDFTEPMVRAAYEGIDVGDKRILIIRVEPGDHVHRDRSGHCYLRVGDESRRLSHREQQELEYDRGGPAFESMPVGVGVSDLDPVALGDYQKTIGAESVESMLHARDLVTRRGQLTVAAELLFDSRPQQDFPSAHVRILTYDSDDRGTGSSMSLTEDVRVEGSIPQQIDEAARVIDARIPSRQQLQPSGRFERVPIIPRDVWLEGLVNAVIHRSYSLMGDHVRVEIFPHRVEISSPGRFPGFSSPSDPLSVSRFARNPRIARVCADMGITRELGEGIKRMFAEMRKRGLTDPLYRQTPSSVTLHLSARDALNPSILEAMSKSARRVLDILRLEGVPLGTGQIAQLGSMARPTASRALQNLRDAGLVEWNGESPQDPRATWRLL